MSAELELLAEKVAHLDLTSYVQVEAGTSVRDAINQMRNAGHNCALIVADGKLTGIFTDRDVLRKVVDHPEVWRRPVDEVMTRDPRTVDDQQPAADALKMMDDLNFRNIPVVAANGALRGNLTHFSLIHYLADLYPEEVYNLPPEPDQFGDTREGG